MTIILNTKFKQTEIGEIPEEWEIFTIQQLKERSMIIEFQDGNHGELHPRKKDYSNEGRSFLTANVVRDGRVYFDEAPKLPEDHCKKLRIGFSRPGDVLLTHNATVGRVAVLPQQAGECIVGTSITYYRLNLDKISNRYFAYFLSSKYFQNQLKQVMAQTTRNQVPITAQSRLYVILSPIIEQRLIAKTLSDLDSKIELNRQMNKTIETIGNALFRHWFIDFEFPNEGGKPYKSSGGKMIHNEELNKMIPKDWTVQPLGELGDFKNGINYSRNDHGNTIFHIINVRDLVSHNFILKSTLDKIKIDYNKAKDYLLKEGDVVIARSASPGETIFIVSNIEKLIYSGFSIRFRSKNPVYAIYLFNNLQKLKYNLSNISDGTTLKNINQETLKKVQIIIPKESVIIKYNSVFSNLYKKIILLLEENKSLSEIRNSLLPKLMSGKIRVPTGVT